MDDRTLHMQKGPTCGVYSLAYALQKLGIKEIPDDSELQGWAQCVAFDNKIKNGCNPIELTKFINSRFSVSHGLTATLYADVDDLRAHTSVKEVKDMLSTLQQLAIQLGNRYINQDYYYNTLEEGQICIGIFVSGAYDKIHVKEPFITQFATNATALHYMMIQKMERQCVVYDSNVGYHVPFPIEKDITRSYTYSGLAIVLTRDGK